MYVDTNHAARHDADAASPRARPRIVVIDPNADAWSGTDLVAARYDMTLALDPRRGVEMARRRGADCVVAEVSPHGKPRYDLVGELRRDARTRAVSVILIAGREGASTALEAVRSGADDYLVRPFLPAELVTRIEMQLRWRRHQAAETAERRRLADLLHSDLQQLLVAAEMRLGMAANRRAHEEMVREVAQAREILARARRSAQELNRQLRPLEPND
ncbi:MAG TPA: hypothetical protein VF720_07025 [Candidatus Eisenbacteria bacterium]